MMTTKVLCNLRNFHLLNLTKQISTINLQQSTFLHHSELSVLPKREFKSDLKIKWVRPEKVSCIKPEKSGDLSKNPDFDPKTVYKHFNNPELLSTISEEQKKLYTLEFLPTTLTKQMVVKDVLSRVQRHDLDYGSIESKIAKMTVDIRLLQKHMELHPRSSRTKVILVELIQRRKKFLKYLRRWDYKKFEWLLEKLDIVYKSPPEEFYQISRKDSLRKLTNEHCENIKTTRLNEYKEKLDSEKVAFEKEKAEILAWIAEEERACGITTATPKVDSSS